MASKQPGHFIQRLTIEADLESKLKANPTQNELSRIFNNQLIRIAEKIMDEEDVPDHLLRIRSLDIDLGDLSEAYLEGDLVTAFTTRFRAALQEMKAKAGYQNPYFDREAELVALFPAKSEFLTYFLKHGRFPSGTYGFSEKPENVLMEMAQEDPESTRKFIKALVQKEPKVAERIVSQFSNTTLRTVFRLFSPSYADFIQREIAQIEPELRKVTKLKRDTVNIYLKRASLAFLLKNHQILFSRQQFLTSLQQQLEKMTGEPLVEIFPQANEGTEETLDKETKEYIEKGVERLRRILKNPKALARQENLPQLWEQLVRREPAKVMELLEEVFKVPGRLLQLVEELTSELLFSFIAKTVPASSKNLIRIVTRIISAHASFLRGRQAETFFRNMVHSNLLKFLIEEPSSAGKPKEFVDFLEKKLKSIPQVPEKFKEQWESFRFAEPPGSQAEEERRQKAEEKAEQEAAKTEEVEALQKAESEAAQVAEEEKTKAEEAKAATEEAKEKAKEADDKIGEAEQKKALAEEKKEEAAKEAEAERKKEEEQEKKAAEDSVAEEEKEKEAKKKEAEEVKAEEEQGRQAEEEAQKALEKEEAEAGAEEALAEEEKEKKAKEAESEEVRAKEEEVRKAKEKTEGEAEAEELKAKERAKEKTKEETEEAKTKALNEEPGEEDAVSEDPTKGLLPNELDDEFKEETDPEQAQVDFIIHFLREGELPWWAKNLIEPDPRVVIQNLVDSKSPVFLKAFKKLLLNLPASERPAVAARFISRFGEENMTGVLTGLMTNIFGFLGTMALALDEFQKKGNAIPEKTYLFKGLSFRWHYIVRFFMDYGQNLPGPNEFVNYVVEMLAAGLSVPITEVAEKLREISQEQVDNNKMRFMPLLTMLPMPGTEPVLNSSFAEESLRFEKGLTEETEAEAEAQVEAPSTEPEAEPTEEEELTEEEAIARKEAREALKAEMERVKEELRKQRGEKRTEPKKEVSEEEKKEGQRENKDAQDDEAPSEKEIESASSVEESFGELEAEASAEDKSRAEVGEEQLPSDDKQPTPAVEELEAMEPATEEEDDQGEESPSESAAKEEVAGEEEEKEDAGIEERAESHAEGLEGKSDDPAELESEEDAGSKETLDGEAKVDGLEEEEPETLESRHERPDLDELFAAFEDGEEEDEPETVAESKAAEDEEVGEIDSKSGKEIEERSKSPKSEIEQAQLEDQQSPISEESLTEEEASEKDPTSDAKGREDASSDAETRAKDSTSDAEAREEDTSSDAEAGEKDSISDTEVREENSNAEAEDLPEPDQEERIDLKPDLDLEEDTEEEDSPLEAVLYFLEKGSLPQGIYSRFNEEQTLELLEEALGIDEVRVRSAVGVLLKRPAIQYKYARLPERLLLRVLSLNLPTGSERLFISYFRILRTFFEGFPGTTAHYSAAEHIFTYFSGGGPSDLQVDTYLRDFLRYMSSELAKPQIDLIEFIHDQVTASPSRVSVTLKEIIAAIRTEMVRPDPSPLPEDSEEQVEKKADAEEVEEPDVFIPEAEDPEDEYIYINNAGLSLTLAVLPATFKALGYLTPKGKFASEELRVRAVHFLAYLSHMRLNPPEEELIYNKLIVGMEIDQTLSKELTLTDDEKETAEELITTIMAQWKGLHKVSSNSFRASWLQREGRLRKENGDKWTVRVDKTAIDRLMIGIPWPTNRWTGRFSKWDIIVEW